MALGVGPLGKGSGESGCGASLGNCQAVSHKQRERCLRFFRPWSYSLPPANHQEVGPYPLNQLPSPACTIVFLLLCLFSPWFPWNQPAVHLKPLWKPELPLVHGYPAGLQPSHFLVTRSLHVSKEKALFSPQFFLKPEILGRILKFVAMLRCDFSTQGTHRQTLENTDA